MSIKCTTCGFAQAPEDRAKAGAGCKGGKPHTWPVSNEIKKSNYGPKGAGLYDPTANIERKARNTGSVAGEGKNSNVKSFSTKPGQLSAKQQAEEMHSKRKNKALSGKVTTPTLTDEEKERYLKNLKMKKDEGEMLEVAPDGKQERVEGKEPLKLSTRWKKLKKALDHQRAFMDLEGEMSDEEEQPQEGGEGQEQEQQQQPPQEGEEQPPQEDEAAMQQQQQEQPPEEGGGEADSEAVSMSPGDEGQGQEMPPEGEEQPPQEGEAPDMPPPQEDEGGQGQEMPPEGGEADSEAVSGGKKCRLKEKAMMKITKSSLMQ